MQCYRVSFVACDFTEAIWNRAGLVDCHIDDGKLDDADFFGSSFVDCRFARCSYVRSTFRGSEIRNTLFSRCDLHRARLWRTTLTRVDFVECDCSTVSLGNTNIADSKIINLIDTVGVTFEAPVNVDWLTLCRSLTAIGLENFLIHAGLPEVFVRYSVDCARSIDKHMLFSLMRSTFISHGGPDAAFAERLCDALISNGVRTFLFGRDATPGEPLHSVMREGIAKHDRIIVICSEVSLNRAGVQNELELTMKREARDGGTSCLIPIILDDYLFAWQPARWHLAQELRDRVVADFRGAEHDELVFRQGVTRLLKALRL